jgi:hypothetical protein
MNEMLKLLYPSQREQERMGDNCGGFNDNLNIITNFTIYQCNECHSFGKFSFILR